MFSQLIETVAGWGGALLVLAAFGLSFGESAVLLDLLVPGEAGMVIVGAASAGSGTPVFVIIPVATVGAVLGDSLGFALGRRYGTKIVCRWGWTRRRLGPKLDRAHDYFESKGGRAVFVGRWVGALRAVVPMVAGSARMPYHRFLLWDVPAAASWMTVVVLAGYIFGRRAAEFADRLGGWVSISVLAVLVLYVGMRKWRRRRQASGDASERQIRGGPTSATHAELAGSDAGVSARRTTGAGQNLQDVPS